MKLRQLQCLCAVADAGFNVSRASEILHATQPAISKQLRQLEDELGADLLVRQGKRMLGVTEAGEQALDWARRALQCADNLRAAVQQEAGHNATSIDLATTHTHANYVLLPAILAFNRRYPKVRIRVQQGGADQVAELVREGKVSLGIIQLSLELPRDVVAVPFLYSRLILVTPAGHPLLDEPELTLDKIASYPLVLQDPVRPQGLRILRRFQEAKVDVNVSVQALDADVLKTYVAAGLGVGIVPYFVYSEAHDPGLRVRSVEHLFSPIVSAVLLRRRSYVRMHVFTFLEQLGADLDRERIEALVFGND